MEQKYLNEEKTLEEMVDFIHNKAKKHLKNGWTYITNEVVFAWAIMYFALPNKLLKIDRNKSVQNQIKTSQENKNNNVISIEKGKKIVEKKKTIEQLSLFGGVV